MKSLRVALAQINSTVGDFEGNGQKIIKFIEVAKERDADVVVFPELAVTGYPPEDLVLRSDFINANLKTLKLIAESAVGIAVVVGYIEKDRQVYNSAAFIYDGRIYGTYRKIFLPNYGVFDEKRYFSPGTEVPVFDFGGVTLGINICEDIWYPDGPAVMQTAAGAGIILNLNASPYQTEKWKAREKMISTRAADNASYVVYVNLVGGQDELLFEGGSLIFDPVGTLIARGKFFEEDLIISDLEIEKPFRARLHDLRLRERISICRDNPPVKRISVYYESRRLKKPLDAEAPVVSGPERAEEIYRALVLGVKDYFGKNNFHNAVIGISGGVDSALVASVAADALGAENVMGLFMPSRYTSKESREDAEELAKNLGFKLTEISIEGLFEKYIDLLAPFFKDLPADNTEQNIQARIRGNLLMAYSNKFGGLVLTTGNKSEMAVGYATLYGDMAGGFAVLKDIEKMTVYELARYRNSVKPAIPERILKKAPTAELKENQKDSDNLPPYEVLDPILKALIEEDRDLSEIIDMGFDASTVEQVAKMVQVSEYKRRQAPPGIKITQRAFGRDRRIPITNKFRA